MTNNSSDLNALVNKINGFARGGVQPQSQSKAFERYVDKLIEEKGFFDLSEDVRKELKKDLLRRLDDFIAAKVISALSDEDLLKFEEMLKSGKPQEEIQQFTTTHVPDFANFLTNTLLEFRAIYLGLIQVPAFVDIDIKKNIEEKSKSALQQPLRKPPPAPVGD